MPKKLYDSDIGEFTITRKRKAKKITLSISKSGLPNVTIPERFPYYLAKSFLRDNRDWANKHKKAAVVLKVGDSYKLYDDTEIVIRQSSKRNS